MILFKLNLILEDLGVSQNNFAKKTNVRPNTINDICKNKTKRIEIATINSILTTLNKNYPQKYNIEDLMEFNDEEQI